MARSISTRVRGPSKNQRTKIDYSYGPPRLWKSPNLLKGKYRRPFYWIHLQRSSIKQVSIGLKPGEERAVPLDVIRGSLPERILYKALMDEFRMIPGIDFDLHSAAHVAIGLSIPGIVFPHLKIVIIINGTGTDTYSHLRKDAEVRMAVEGQGYEVYEIPMEIIDDGERLDNFLKNIFGWSHSFGPDATHDKSQDTTMEANSYSQIEQGIASLKDVLNV